MSYRYGVALALLLAAGLARAQDAPEQLLPASAQLYVRWDGLKTHRAAYEKTALGKMMKGDTGKFLTNVFSLVNDSLSSALTVQGLLEGTKPEELQKLQNNATEAAKLLGVLSEHGFILAAEVRSVMPPAVQVTFIMPGAGTNPKPLFGAIGLIAGLAKAPVKETKAEGRTLYSIEAGPANIGWWVEGKHAVFIVSTDKVDEAAKKMRSGNHARLTSNPLYKKLHDFKDFETAARAYIDVASLAKLAATLHKDAGKLIAALGLDGLKSVSFLSGFEGNAERSLTELDVSGGRKGLLSLLGGKPFTLADVPPLPPDVISWSMTTFDTGAYYDTFVKAAEVVVGMIAPEQLPRLKEFLKQADAAVGVDIRKDLLGSLGDRMVQYNSPAEGVFTFGQTIMVKVKDAQKLEESLEKAIKSLAMLTNADVKIKSRKYRGVDMREVYVGEKGFIFVPTYTIHNGWLVIGYYPQLVQGYILRAKGELKAWKPGPSARKSLDMLPKEFLSVSVSDPRPSVKQILALAPLIGGAVRSFFPDTKFDVGLIPNSHEVCKHLFPNVTVVADEGKVVRIHTRASLGLPFDVAGLDAYVLAYAGIAAFFAFGGK
jgi:hypothetical protein